LDTPTHFAVGVVRWRLAQTGKGTVGLQSSIWYRTIPTQR